MGSIPASRAIAMLSLRKSLSHKNFRQFNTLDESRLDTSADTLTEEHGQFLRALSPGLAMKKWPGFTREGGRMRFQKRIPQDVRHAFDGAEWIRFPLDYPTEREAQRNALAWSAAYEHRFAQIRGEASGKWREAPKGASAEPPERPLSEYTPAEMRALIAPTASGISRTQHEAISTGAVGFDQLATDQAQLADTVRDVLSGRGSKRLELLSALFLAVRGIPEGTPEAFKRFVHVSASALHSLAVTPNAQRLAGEPVEPPPPLDPVPLGAGLRIKASVATPRGLTLGPLIADYVAAYPRNEYRRKMALALTLFREVVGGSLPVQHLKRAHVAGFLETVCKLPSDWAERFKKGETLEGLLADVDSEGIAKSTYEDNYRGTLRKFLRDMDAKYGDQGFPVLSAQQEYTGTRDKGESKQRHLEEAELVRLFQGAEFTAIAADPAQGHHYWLPVIGLYTGARPREICQLNPQCDWGEVDGVYYFDFNETKPSGKGVVKSIKRGEGRLVAMHPELVRLGFPAYLARLRNAGVDRMFPAFRIKGGNPYTAAGAEFSELLRTTGLYDNETKGQHVTGMYVFRKTFATYGDEQGVNVAPFIGHRDAGKTMAQAHYITRPKSVPLQLAQLRLLTYPVAIPLRSSE